MNCWICGAEADSREHLFKKSDLRRYFGRFDQRAPIYMHGADAASVPIKGPDANAVKLPARLCKRCNSAGSARYDIAWERFSEYVDEVAKHYVGYPPARINLRRALKPKELLQAASASLQLYVVKHGGSIIAVNRPEHPLLRSFAAHFKSGVPHPDVYVAVRWIIEHPTQVVAQITRIEAFEDEAGAVGYMTWAYRLNRAVIQVYYCPDRRKIVPPVWHPRDTTRFIAVVPGRSVSEGMTHFRKVAPSTPEQL